MQIILIPPSMNDMFETKQGCALAITKACATFDEDKQGQVRSKVYKMVQKLSMFELLLALSHTQIDELYIETMEMGANINNQSIQPQQPNFNLLLSIPRAIWPCVGKFLTRFETARIKLIHSKIAIDTDLRSYILGRRSISGNDMINDALYLDAENAFRFCQSNFKPQKIHMELDHEFTQYLPTLPLRNIFKYVHEIEINSDNHKLLPLIPFDSIYDWSNLTLCVACSGAYDLSIYEKLANNLNNGMIGEFRLQDCDANIESMMALVKAFNGKIERLTLDYGCLELYSVTDLQCVFGKGLKTLKINKDASIYDGIKRKGTQQAMNELISCDLSTLTIQHTQKWYSEKHHTETITMLQRHNILYNVTTANIDLTLCDDNNNNNNNNNNNKKKQRKNLMSEWLCVLLDPIWRRLKCPHLRLVNINTQITNSIQLQSLIDEIKPLAKFYQHPILIQQLQIAIEIENYQCLTNCELNIENEFIKNTPYGVGTQENIYTLCELLASKQHVYKKTKHGKDLIKMEFHQQNK